MENKFPKELGYRLPAEWEPHQATWLSWPRREGISFPGAYDEVMPTFLEMVQALTKSEDVHINISDKKTGEWIQKNLKATGPFTVRYFDTPTNEPWCRDHGPIFIKHAKTGELAVTQWKYNAWGGKYPPFDKDEKVPAVIADKFKLKRFVTGIILEGGSIDGNGQGTILTTESCLLNPNRNPHLNKDQIEAYLRNFLCADQILWLGDGIVGDDTDGHVDDITRFVGPKTVVTVVESDKKDDNHKPLKENLERLKQMKLLDGSPLGILTLPMPKAVIQEDTRLPASYGNFYIGNSVVLLPVFDDPKDKEAISLMKSVFPGREIVPINCRKLVWGLGAFHCLTQQHPL